MFYRYTKMNKKPNGTNDDQDDVLIKDLVAAKKRAMDQKDGQEMIS